MQDNNIDPDSFEKKFDENLFLEAVEKLSENDILFEGQFPFLNDASMRDRNIQTLKDILKKFGYDNAEQLCHISVEIEGKG